VKIYSISFLGKLLFYIIYSPQKNIKNLLNFQRVISKILIEFPQVFHKYDKEICVGKIYTKNLVLELCWKIYGYDRLILFLLIIRKILKLLTSKNGQKNYKFELDFKK